MLRGELTQLRKKQEKEFFEFYKKPNQHLKFANYYFEVVKNEITMLFTNNFHKFQPNLPTCLVSSGSLRACK